MWAQHKQELHEVVAHSVLDVLLRRALVTTAKEALQEFKEEAEQPEQFACELLVAAVTHALRCAVGCMVC